MIKAEVISIPAIRLLALIALAPVTMAACEDEDEATSVANSDAGPDGSATWDAGRAGAPAVFVDASAEAGGSDGGGPIAIFDAAAPDAPMVPVNPYPGLTMPPAPGVDLEPGSGATVGTANVGFGVGTIREGGSTTSPAAASPTWVPGVRGGSALRLNGTSQFVSYPVSPELNKFTEPLTIAAWIRSAATKPGRAWIAHRAFSFGLGLEDGKPLGMAHFTPCIPVATVLPPGQWVHLALTYDGISMWLFVNGEPVGQCDLGQGVLNDENPLIIGGATPPGSNTVSEFWNGDIDEFLIFKRVISDDEVAALAKLK